VKTVAIIGLGTMGSAIARSLGGSYAVIGLDQGDDLGRAQAADIVIIAVKPQSFEELSQSLRPHVENQTVLSIMAGVGVGQVAERLGAKHVFRLMPNLGLAKAKSLTAVYQLDSSNRENNRQEIDKLLSLWGGVVWLQKEADFNAFTALAGSGPAYFFELTAQLQQAAEQLGFDEELARQIANSTLASAAAMLDGSGESAAEKARQVASQGGTTEAALNVFAKHDFAGIVLAAARAAANRSKELSGGH